MRILLVHNYYGTGVPSGENQVFKAERDLLRAHGHEVTEFTRSSDEIRSRGMKGAIQGALSVPWNPRMAHAIKSDVKAFRPDIVHVHNTFPLISPAIFHAIGSDAARVLTLHNYRLFCAAAVPLRSGNVCTECLDSRSPWPALRHACYRSSRLATIPLAIGISLCRTLGTWTNQVEGFIALTDFQRKRMVAAGLPAGRVHVKPHFYPGNPTPIPWQQRAPYAAYVGRLTAEKGVQTLVRAWRLWGANAPELRIIGEGALRPALSREAEGLPIRFLGQMSRGETLMQIAGARLLVLASESFETFGLTVVEAFAHGTPAAVSDIGPLSSIVTSDKNGLLFRPGNQESLINEIHRAWSTSGLLERLGQGARATFEDRFMESANYVMLMEIYRRAIDASRLPADASTELPVTSSERDAT